MNAPADPPNNVPPESGAADQATNTEEQKANLSHFAKKQNPDGDIPYKKRTDVLGAISSVSDKIKDSTQTAKESLQTAQKAAGKVAGKTQKSRKYLVPVLIALLVVPILAFIGINIPSQIARSTAFAMYEEGKYEEALQEFRAYLLERPGDSEAMLYAVQTAMRAGDFAYASSTSQRLSSMPEFARDPDVMFVRALSTAPAPNALETLNSLVSLFPEHTGGRLLRGILLARQKDIQRAREDFLTADSVIRDDRNHDNTGILAVHRRVASAPDILPVFELPFPEDAPALQDLSARLNMQVPPLYFNRYIPVLPSDAEAAGLADDNIISIYYTLMLMESGQLDEAQVEFSKLSQNAMTQSMAGSLDGINSILTGDYQKAESVFRSLSGLPEATGALLFNLANISFLRNPTYEGAVAAEEIMAKAVSLDAELPVAQHNRGFLQLVIGNSSQARQQLTKTAQSDPADAESTKLLEALAALTENPRDEAMDALLEELPSSLPGATEARVAYLVANERYLEAISVLQEQADTEPEWNISNRQYARLLADAGFLMRARNVLLSRGPQELPEVKFETAFLNISAGNLPGAEAILKELADLQAENSYTYALRALVENFQGESSAAVESALNAMQAASEDKVRSRLVAALADILIEDHPGVLIETLRNLDSLDSEGTALLARLAAGQGDSELLDAAVAAAERYPFFNVQRHVSAALRVAGNSEQALEFMRAASAWRPSNIPLLQETAELLEGNGKGEEAQQVQQAIANIRRLVSGESSDSEVLSIDIPKDPVLIKHVTRARKEPDAVEPALQRFEELLLEAQSDKAQAQLMFQRATFLLAAGKYSECEQGMLEARSKGLPPEYAKRVGAYLGKALALQQKFVEATAVYRELSEQNPESALYRRQTGIAMSNLADISNSLEWLRETVKLFPADIASYFALSEAYQKGQNSDEAVAVLRSAMRAAPLYVPIYANLSRILQITDIAAARENSIIANQLSGNES